MSIFSDINSELSRCTPTLYIFFIGTIKKGTIVMNLHEECLLKYLLHPLDLMYSTEALKINNNMIEKNLCRENFLAKKTNINYTRM